MNRIQSRSARGYNRIAGIYRPLETLAFGSALQRARTALLDDLGAEGAVLFLGDGNGRLLKAFCCRYPSSHGMSVDHSPAMLRRQDAVLSGLGVREEWELCCEDLRNWRPAPEQYDLVVAAFVLDCFSPSELDANLDVWLAGIKPGGLLYFVDFVTPTSGWSRVRSFAYQKVMHWFFRWQTDLPNRSLVDLPSILESRGWGTVRTVRSKNEMLASTLYRRREGAGGLRGPDR